MKIMFILFLLFPTISISQTSGKAAIKHIDDFLRFQNIPDATINKYITEARDPNIKSFWEFYRAYCNRNQDECVKQFLAILQENPKAKFPNFDWGRDYAGSWLHPFIIANHPMEPLIYFEVAENCFSTMPDQTDMDWTSSQSKASIEKNTMMYENNLNVWESYYKKILTLNGSDYWTDSNDEITFKVKALEYLLHDYGLTHQFEKVPAIAKQILLYKNQFYSIHEWPTTGESHADALIALIFLSKDLNDDTKSIMLKKLFIKYDTSYGQHGGPGNSYAMGAINLLLECMDIDNDRLESVLKYLLADTTIREKYGVYLYVLLGNIEFAKENKEYAKNSTQIKNWEISRKYYAKALEYKSQFAHQYDDSVVELLALKKFVSGDLSKVNYMPVPLGEVFNMQYASFDFIPNKLETVP